VSRYGRIIAVILFLALLFGVAELSGLRAHFSIAYLQQILGEHPVGGLAVFVLLFSLGNLIQVPGFLFAGAAVLALGRTWGGLVTYLAACVSCVVTFFAIRTLGGNALADWKNRTAARLLYHLHARPVRNVALLRVMFQTLPALNYALAMSGVKFRAYAAGSVLGLPLPIAVYCLMFDYVLALLQHS
jgi:uncharacterized membrane protein YdjX (TVP38/TMEM64 family)